MNKKVLLVDDEKDMLMVIGIRIKAWGYDLIEASSGKEALKAIPEKKPDMVILDYIMPEMDGIATLKEIRKFDTKIPVIIFTAFPDHRSIEEAKMLGVCAFVPKLSAHSSSESLLKEALRLAETKLK